MQEVATIAVPESQNWSSLISGGASNTSSLSPSMITSLQSSIGVTDSSVSPKQSDSSSNGVLPSVRRTPVIEANGLPSSSGESKVSPDLNDAKVMESLMTSLNQFSLQQQQEAPAQFTGLASQWPSGDVNSMYGGSGLSDPSVTANIAAQLQALALGAAGRSQQEQQQQLQLQQLQQQQLRALSGLQLDGNGLLQTLQQRQSLTMNSPSFMGNSTYTGGVGNAGINSWGSMNGFGIPQQQQQQHQSQQRFSSQHNRSMSAQNINMASTANGGMNQLNEAYARFPAVTSGISGVASPGGARYSNGKSFGDQSQLSKNDSAVYGQNTSDLLRNLSLYQSQKGNGSNPSVDSWLDLIRYSQEGLQHQRCDTNNLLDVNSLNIGHWDSKSVQSRGASFPYGFTDSHQQQQQQLLSDAMLGHSLSAGLKLSPTTLSPVGATHDNNEMFSRKVFVGGLPPDIDEDEIMGAFRRFGHVTVDWPHKAESKSYFPPKGYCFLLFQDELSVQLLVEGCKAEDGKLYWGVSSPTMKDKMVQIRPWRLDDSDFVMDGSQPLDPRKTVFVGGVPRPLRAVELAVIMGRLYGSVCYAGIDTDPELKYPKGAGRVAFSSQQSYIAAISARFVQLQHGDIDKRVEVKPYVLDDQICDECQGVLSGGKYAPYFCANVTCLQYYCEACWSTIHSTPGREFHKPLMKEGSDRPRAMPRRL